MRDCNKCPNTAINCTETTEVPNRHTQNSNPNQTGTTSHPTPSDEAPRSEDSGNAAEKNPDALAPPWYSNGLKFECTQCGDCCTGGPGAVWVTDQELAEIAAELGKPIGEVRLLHTKIIGGRWSLRDYPNGDCVFLDPQTQGCQVYAVRPIQCRTWPFWPSNIETTDSWKRTCSVCPGAGVGKLHSLENIQIQAGACDL